VTAAAIAYEWHAEPSVVAGCVVALLLFANGFVRLRRRGRKDLAGWGRAALFITAIAMVYLALDSPLDAIADDYLLSAHMLEHVMIGDLAIALAMLAVRGPLIFFLLPAAVLSPLARNKPLRAFLHWLTGPWVALAVWTAGMWAWHVPRIYDYAATHQTVHQLEHLSFMLGGILVWNLLIDPARTHRLTVPGRILLAVGIFLLGDPVMATLFGGGANYPHYASQPDRLLGLSPRLDQRLAGTVMLVEQILTLGTCCAVLLWPYLRSHELGAEESALS
jgi:putative membrane protein